MLADCTPRSYSLLDCIWLGFYQVLSLHIAIQKFNSLVPFVIDKGHLENIEVDWKKETIDEPVASKLRILTGKEYLSSCNFPLLPVDSSNTSAVYGCLGIIRFFLSQFYYFLIHSCSDRQCAGQNCFITLLNSILDRSL